MQKALDVENEISSMVSKSPCGDSISSLTTKKAIIKEERKDKYVFDKENLHKVMKTLANEIVDVKGKLDEVLNKPFMPFFKRNPQIPPSGQTLEGVNVIRKKERVTKKLMILIYFCILIVFLMKMIQKNLLLLKPEVKVTDPPTNTSNTQLVENK
jgi:hypothetical protein